MRNPKGGPFVDKSDLVLDWFIENEGPGNVVGSYFIDVYLDEILAERWNGSGISPDHFVFIEGYTDLLDLFHLEPGTHTVKLVVDPTNRINERAEVDNSYSAQFTWAGEAIPTPLPGTRLPNLSITTGVGEKAPMIVSPFASADSSGGLSIHGDTHMSISVLNDSPIPIDQPFSIHILFDDIVVRQVNYLGLRGGSTLEFDWSGLNSAVPISAGLHTVKLIVDATGIVTEGNEADNTYEIELAWGADSPLAIPEPLPAPVAPARAAHVLPNLTGFVPYGWDAAIVVSSSSAELAAGRDGPVWTTEASTISFAVRNISSVSTQASGAFQIDVLIDGELIDSRLYSVGYDSGSVWSGSVEVPPNSISAGQHLVQVVIDSEQAISESDEIDNSIARYLNWNPGPAVAVVPEEFTLTDEQLDELLAPVLDFAFIDQVRATSGSGLELPDWTSAIGSAGKAGYYLLTGKDLDSERFVMHLLPHDQFIAAKLNACMAGYQWMNDSVYTTKFASCLDLNAVGLKHRQNGKIHVLIDLGESPIDALGTYFHELGHALQDITNPELTATIATQNLNALHEAQAQIFEAAAVRAIEEYSGKSLMRFPDVPTMRSSVEFSLENTSNQIGSVDHALGYRILWMESLANTSGLGTDIELLNNKRLSSSTAKALFDYLVAMQPDDIDSWISEIFAVPTRDDQFKAISLSRLENDLPNVDYGNPDLLQPAFLAP